MACRGASDPSLPPAGGEDQTQPYAHLPEPAFTTSYPNPGYKADMELGFSKDFWPRSQPGAGPTDALRPLVWDELCAKLSALQHLRRAATRGELGGGSVSHGTESPSGHFHGPAARAIAGKDLPLDVNLNPLANGKAGAGITQAHQTSPVTGTRGQE